MTATDRHPAPRRRSRRAVASVAVAIAAIAGGGAAVAASDLSSPQADSDALIADAAGRLGVEPEALDNALKQAYEARIDAQVQAGELDQEQADALKQRLEAGDVPLVGGGLRGERGERERGGFRLGPGEGHRGGRVMIDLGTAATYLGLDAEELRAKLEAGQSLADVAKAQGKTTDGLKQAFTESITKSLDEQVASGELSADEKADILADLPAHLDEVIAGTAPRGGPGRHGRGFGGPDGPGFGLMGAVDAASTYLGLSLEELRTQLGDGKTLAEIATAQGKTVDGLKQALTEAVTKTLDERVVAGDLTEADKAAILKDLPARLDDQLNGTFQGRTRFRFRGGDERPAPVPAPAAPAAPDEGTTPGGAPQDPGTTTTPASHSI